MTIQADVPRSNDAQKRKLSVNLSEDASQVVRELAVRKGMTVTDVIRRAISLERFVVDQLDEGKTFVVRRPDGSTETVHFVF